MIVETYRTNGKEGKRYVRKCHSVADFYSWCITEEKINSKTRFDVAQGRCNGSDLPADLKKICDEYQGSFYACEWPKG